MVNLILGVSGSGKTKYLIDEANKEKANGNGNIVFIGSDDSQIFSLDYSVRLIDAHKYNINSVETLYGFIAGISSRDYDIEKMYLDGLYDIVEFTKENLSELIKKLDVLCKDFNLDIFIGVDNSKVELPNLDCIKIKEL